MKPGFMRLGLIGLAGIAASTLCFASAGYAGNPPQNRQSLQPQTETFTGVVTREPSDRAPVPYILYDQNRKTNFYLADDNKIAKYDEKEVEITGTLDHAKNTIEVKSVKGLN